MALLDVSEVIRDPLFTTPIKLVRRIEDVDDDGNAVWRDDDALCVEAVVTADTKTIERLPDALQRAGTILVRFMVDDAPGFQGSGYDFVVWRGKRFVVKDATDYAHFGQGFIRMVCWPEEVSDGGY